MGTSRLTVTLTGPQAAELLHACYLADDVLDWDPLVEDLAHRRRILTAERRSKRIRDRAVHELAARLGRAGIDVPTPAPPPEIPARWGIR